MVGERAPDSEGPRRDLSRFAYGPALPSPPRRAGPAPTRPRPARVPAKNPPGPRLAQLSECVACGRQWTSKKTARQKRSHIERCARQNALSKDTVRILVERETTAQNPTATLMDAVVSAEPATKYRRQQVVPTIRSLPETRESILHRAKDILGPAMVQAEPLPTQQFGQSALARNPQQTNPALPGLIQGTLRGKDVSRERSANDRDEHAFLPARQFGTSMFAQDDVSSSDPSSHENVPCTDLHVLSTF